MLKTRSQLYEPQTPIPANRGILQVLSRGEVQSPALASYGFGVLGKSGMGRGGSNLPKFVKTQF